MDKPLFRERDFELILALWLGLFLGAAAMGLLMTIRRSDANPAPCQCQTKEANTP